MLGKGSQKKVIFAIKGVWSAIKAFSATKQVFGPKTVFKPLSTVFWKWKMENNAYNTKHVFWFTNSV